MKRTAAGAALALMLTLTACSGSDGPDPDEGATMTSSAGAEEVSGPDSGEASSDEDSGAEDADQEDAGGAAEIEGCDGFLFEEGGEVDGQVLADCLVGAMMLAGSGSHIVNADGEITTADFEWDPEFGMHVQGPEMSVVVHGDDAWVDLGNGWVHGDPNSSDPEEMMAGTILELARATGDPRAIAEVFLQNSWTIVSEGEVPDPEAFTDHGWLLEPNGPITIMGVTATDVELWLTTDYLGAYYVATASAMGVTATTSSTFTQWGEPVDLPRPGV